MHEPVKFKRLKEIASELNAKLDELHIGKLSKEELEQLTEYSRELYERLVVLRFKAYDKEVKMPTDTQSEEKKEPVISLAINITEPKDENSGQVSLIDAIEEITSGSNDKIEFPVDESEIRRTEIIIPPLRNESTKILTNTSQVSLHDKLSKSIGSRESLAEKLENSPIADLKKAISLNQRFQFSKELFKGNNQEYEMAVDHLNSATRMDAMKLLSNLKLKFSWGEESPIALDFIELVERRHQQ